MDFASALRYLESFFNYERDPARRYDSRRFNLERVRKLLAELGNPHDSGAEIVHIAGTKGKGSTAHMIESILRKAGYRTALYTSPHLVTPRERIRVEGEMIPEEEFAALVEEIKPVAERMRDDPDHGRLTFFEVYTAMAFSYFARKGAEVWVVETGLGGRLDATNVVSPLLTVITLIGFDHTQLLGDTLDRIAYEKAGIIKRGVPVVSAPQPPEAMEVIERRCSELGARLVKVEEACSARVRERSEKGTLFDAWVMGERYEGLSLPLLGDHQVINALTAIAAIEAL
ncbi:bifunctional folylpolyglutamate synthase/dihydrofolate synthase, partial [Candidatus Poribacteria bacterium]